MQQGGFEIGEVGQKVGKVPDVQFLAPGGVAQYLEPGVVIEFVPGLEAVAFGFGQRLGDFVQYFEAFVVGRVVKSL